MKSVEFFKTQSTDDTSLHGQHWPIEKPVAVMALIHGFGEHVGRYADMAAHLNAHGISVVGIDLHGHGQTSGPRGVIRDYNDFRADLAALLAQTKSLYPDAPFILYGHSMGGGVVLDHGFTPYPAIRAIIASAPLIELAEPVPAPVAMIAKLIGKIAPKAAMSQPIVGEKISTLPQEQQAYISDPLNHGRMGFRTAIGLVETGEQIAARAGEWKAPLLLFHSREDVLTRFEASETFAAAAQNVEFHPFENSAHEMHNDVTRAAVYDLMTQFILKHAT